MSICHLDNSRIFGHSVENGFRILKEFLWRIEFSDLALLKDDDFVVVDDRVEAMRDCQDCAIAEGITNCFLNCKEGGKHIKSTIVLRRCSKVIIVHLLNKSQIVF